MFRALVFVTFGFFIMGCSTQSNIATEKNMDQGRKLSLEDVFADSEDLFPLSAANPKNFFLEPATSGN